MTAAFIIAGVVLLLLAILGGAWCAWDCWSIGGPLLLTVAGVGSLVAFAIPVGRAIDRTNQQNACTTYASRTDLPVEFIDLSYWTYGCYVNVNGDWVSTSGVRVVLEP